MLGTELTVKFRDFPGGPGFPGGSDSKESACNAVQFSSVQFSCSVMSNSLQPHRLHAALQASLSITNSQSLLKFMSVESVMPSNHLILCHPLLLPPSIFPSIKGFSNESVLHIRWPKYWSFSFSISPSIEYSGLISFRMDWLDLLAVQGSLKSLLQHHSSKAAILQHSAFFMGSIPGLGRSPGEGNGNLLQYSRLENFINRGAWWAIAYGVAKSRTRLSDHSFTFTGGPVVNNLTCNARDRGLVPGPGTKIPFCPYSHPWGCF